MCKLAELPFLCDNSDKFGSLLSFNQKAGTDTGCFDVPCIKIFYLFPALDVLGQLLFQSTDIRYDHCQPFLHGIPARMERICDLGECRRSGGPEGLRLLSTGIFTGKSIKKIRHFPGIHTESLLISGRQQDELLRGVRIGGRWASSLRPFLQNNMRVRAAKTKGTDPGPAGYGVSVFISEPFPVPGFFHHIKRRIAEFDIGVEGLKMRGSRQLPVPKAKDHLDHASDT